MSAMPPVGPKFRSWQNHGRADQSKEQFDESIYEVYMCLVVGFTDHRDPFVKDAQCVKGFMVRGVLPYKRPFLPNGFLHSLNHKEMNVDKDDSESRCLTHIYVKFGVEFVKRKQYPRFEDIKCAKSEDIFQQLLLFAYEETKDTVDSQTALKECQKCEHSGFLKKYVRSKALQVNLKDMAEKDVTNLIIVCEKKEAKSYPHWFLGLVMDLYRNLTRHSELQFLLDSQEVMKKFLLSLAIMTGFSTDRLYRHSELGRSNIDVMWYNDSDDCVSEAVSSEPDFIFGWMKGTVPCIPVKVFPTKQLSLHKAPGEFSSVCQDCSSSDVCSLSPPDSDKEQRQTSTSIKPRTDKEKRSVSSPNQSDSGIKQVSATTSVQPDSDKDRSSPISPRMQSCSENFKRSTSTPNKPDSGWAKKKSRSNQAKHFESCIAQLERAIPSLPVANHKYAKIKSKLLKKLGSEHVIELLATAEEAYRNDEDAVPISKMYTVFGMFMVNEFCIISKLKVGVAYLRYKGTDRRKITKTATKILFKEGSPKVEFFASPLDVTIASHRTTLLFWVHDLFQRFHRTEELDTD